VTTRKSPRGVGRVVVDEIGKALLIRTPTDPAAALVAMAAALPSEPGRIAIVSAPSITTRRDFFLIMARIIKVHVRASGVRLVALGSTAEPSTVESALQALADRFGHEVVAPLGPVTVSSNGTAAVAVPPGAGGGWVACSPGDPPRYEAAWSPPPAWATPLPPSTAQVTVRGMATAHPVPAGFWVLPPSVRPGSAGPAAAVPPDHTEMTVFVGGCAEPPLASADVIECLTALPLPHRSRIVLLPRAMPPDGDVARLRAWCPMSVRAVAAVPMSSTDQAWGLAFVGVRGHLAWRPPDPPWPASGGFRPMRRDRTVISAWSQQPTPRRRPERSPAPSGVRTPAGWSYLTGRDGGPRPVGVVPAVAGFVVDVDTDAAGLVIHGKSIKPHRLADLIDASCQPRPSTLVVVGHGTPPADPDSVFGTLADSLGGEVIAADSDVSLSQTGLLFTSGRFRSWRAMPGRAGTGPSVQSRFLGDTLPAIPAVPWLDVMLSAQEPRGEPAVARRVVAARRSSTVPHWVTEAPCDSDDNARLRQVLDGRYDAHARSVARTLAEDPGVRDTRPPASTVTGLAAVHAYCTTERETVNRVLRGFGDAQRVASAAVIGSCAAHGLRQLPVVFGPVFATSGASVPDGAYAIGTELVEPGFVDVDLAPNGEPGAGVDYVIWSVSARRLGRIVPTDHVTALFAAGSRFLVLGVDHGPERPRVMLLDLAALHGNPDERGLGRPAADTVERLRHATHQVRGATRAFRGLLGFPIGLDDAGLLY
jgi:hypothetical protein